MAQIANIEYFVLAVEKRFGIKYNQNGWWVNKYSAINIEWLVAMIPKVYNEIHKPKTDCRHPISTIFYDVNINKIAVDKTLVNTVIDYLAKFNMICDIDCACPCTSKNCGSTWGTALNVVMIALVDVYAIANVPQTAPLTNATLTVLVQIVEMNVIVIVGAVMIVIVGLGKVIAQEALALLVVAQIVIVKK